MKKSFSIFILLFILSFLIYCQTNLEIGLGDIPFFSFHEIQLGDKTSLQFELVLPENLDKNKTYPVLLALPPGAQSREEVEFGLMQYWIKSSIQRNWIVVSPIAPGGIRFYEGSETKIGELFDWIQQEFQVEGGRFHISGLSAGGISGFRIAVQYSERCQSLTVLPGYPLEDDYDQLDKLQNIPVSMFVGGYDTSFIQAMDSTYTRLVELGIQVTYNQLPEDEHVITSLTSEYLFDLLDSFRPINGNECITPPQAAEYQKEKH